jgi:hypothetical protein
MTTHQTLEELIGKVLDVEEIGETWTDRNKGLFSTNASNRYEGFKAGASEVGTPLAEALILLIRNISDERDHHGLTKDCASFNQVDSILTKALEKR